ncbi:hypothetical protein NL676_012305 [Syzygium grande]|nr:hypothetical protein NL676_012305 [Syzygium grande]
MFIQSGRQDNDEQLQWATIKRLLMYDRLRKGMQKQVLDIGRVVQHEVDVANLGIQDEKQLMESKVAKEDNEKFSRRLRERIDRVGIEIPKIKVWYEHLSVEGDVRDI